MGGASSNFSTNDGYRWAWDYKTTLLWSPACDCPEETLYFLHDRIATSPSNIVHALIKDNLSALTLIEYVMDYIRFIFIEPSDFVNIDLEKMTAMHKGIAMVVDMLKQTPFYDEEQSRRVEVAYQDIFSAMKESSRLQTDGAVRGDAGSQDFAAWQPVFNLKNSFSSDTEKNFMMRLRHLYATSRTLTAGAIFRRLADICQSVNPEQIMSDVSSNTVIRTVIAIIAKATDKLCSRKDLTERRFNILKSYLDGWAELPTRGNKIADSACCVFIMKQRSMFLDKLLFRARATCRQGSFEKAKPVKVEQPNLNQALSPFWKELQSIKSLSDLMKLSEQHSCTICQEADIQPINFAILDKCLHVYCVGCIEAWFRKSNICPYCRVQTTNWTTRDHFLAFREQLSTAAQTEQPDISGTA